MTTDSQPGDTRPTAGTDAGPTPPAPGAAVTLLVVDDEPALRWLARTALQGFGYEVLVAEDGARALEVFRNERRRVRLVLLDLFLPDRGGLDVLADLAGLEPGVSALLMTGHEPPALPPELARHVRGVLTKPFDLNELRRAVGLAAPTPGSGPAQAGG